MARNYLILALFLLGLAVAMVADTNCQHDRPAPFRKRHILMARAFRPRREEVLEVVGEVRTAPAGQWDDLLLAEQPRQPPPVVSRHCLPLSQDDDVGMHLVPVEKLPHLIDWLATGSPEDSRRVAIGMMGSELTVWSKMDQYEAVRRAFLRED